MGMCDAAEGSEFEVINGMEKTGFMDATILRHRRDVRAQNHFAGLEPFGFVCRI